MKLAAEQSGKVLMIGYVWRFDREAAYIVDAVKCGDLGKIYKTVGLCYCGKRGCLETFSADKFIINKAKEALITNQKTLVREFIKERGGLDSITIDMTLKSARKGNETARNFFKKQGQI